MIGHIESGSIQFRSVPGNLDAIDGDVRLQIDMDSIGDHFVIVLSGAGCGLDIVPAQHIDGASVVELGRIPVISGKIYFIRHISYMNGPAVVPFRFRYGTS